MRHSYLAVLLAPQLLNVTILILVECTVFGKISHLVRNIETLSILVVLSL